MDVNELNRKYDFSKAVIKCNEENNPPDIKDLRKIHLDILVPKRFSDIYLNISKDINEDELNGVK